PDPTSRGAPMFTLFRRRFTPPNARRPRRARPCRLESLEGRTLLALTPINFPATVMSTPVAMGTNLFFQGYDPTHGTQLWETDGTAAGTVMLTNANAANGGLNPESLTVVGNTLYFAGGDSHGTQLWKSDGTVAGTTIVTTSNRGI